MDKVEYRITLPKGIDRIIEATLEEGMYVNKNDVVRAAVVKYLDDMHLLDQVKSSVRAHHLESNVHKD